MIGPPTLQAAPKKQVDFDPSASSKTGIDDAAGSPD